MRFTVCFIALAMTAPAYTQTSPEAPMLTAGAEFKGLRFDWEPAAGASWYALEYQAHQNAVFTQLGSDLPASATSFRYRFPLHLFDWTYARYRLAACNASGCTRSTQVSVSSLRRFAVGYFKAGDSQPGVRFGADTDISSDGLHFVTTAPFAQSTVGAGSQETGAAYLFARRADGSWYQRAKLAPTFTPFGKGLAMRVSISADGNTVAVGLPQYAHNENDAFGSGEVFVFRFDGTYWQRTRLYSGIRGNFGRWVSLNEAGDTLALSTRTIDPVVLIYRLIGGTWQPVRQFPTSEYCNEGQLSGDGSTLAEPCVANGGTPTVRDYVRVHSGPNWTVREELPLTMSTPAGPPGYGHSVLALDTTGDTIAAQVYIPNIDGNQNGPSQVSVFRRNAGVYSQVAELKPGSWRATDDMGTFGNAIAMSGDGQTIAVGDSRDNGLGFGPRAAPLNPGEVRTGAVYVFRWRGTWRLANMVKPNYRPVDGGQIFGRGALALSNNGQTLLVSDPGEASGADGIGGDWVDDEAPESGAVWLY